MNFSKIHECLDNISLIKNKKKIGVAVSGGVDSMSLLHVASNWARKYSKELCVLSFDHNLRKESFQDIELVKFVAKSLNLEHKYFIWQEKPSSAVLEKARIARYKTFSEYCRSKDIDALLVAHTADDIAETMAIRILNKSNLDGLCPMVKQKKIFDIFLVRPFLHLRKYEIYKFAQTYSIKYNEDPSNTNNKYLRSRVRRYLNSNNKLTEGFIKASSLYCNLRKIKSEIIKNKFKDYFDFKIEGYVVIKKELLLDFPKFLILSFFKNCLMQIGNRKYPPSTKKLIELFSKSNMHMVTNFSLCGCIISLRKEKILIIREYNKIKSLNMEIKNKNTLLWDNRFILSNLPKNKVYNIFPLGNIIDRSYIKQILEKYKKNNCKIPFFVKKTLPVIKTLEGLILIPHFNIYESTKDKIKIDINGLYDKNDNNDF